MNVIGAIDVGSNAIRLLIANFEASGRYRVIESVREPVRLGGDVFRSGTISRHTMDSAVGAFFRFKQLLNRHKASVVTACATSAMRDAKNGDLLAARIKQTTGIELSVISGQEEARLISLAVQSKLRVGNKRALFIDIGGGSVETTIVDRGNVVFSESAQVGTVRLLKMINGRSFDAVERLVRSYAQRFRRDLSRDVRARKIQVCVGTGGNIEEFGELRKKFLKKKSSNQITLSELTTLLDQLKGLTSSAREAKFELRPDRADVIVPAGMILQTIMQQAGVTALKIPGVGLKEGILIDSFRGLRSSDRHEPIQQREQQILAFSRGIANKYQVHLQHAESVRAYCLTLFDATKKLHGYNGEVRTLLQVTALLHDVGHFISSEDHHKHSYYIIKETPIVGLTDRQRLIVAIAARFHRRGLPKSGSLPMTDLTRPDQQIARTIAAILRVADCLDAEHLKTVKSLRVRRSLGAVTLLVKGTGEMKVEITALEGRKNLFESVFAVKLRIEKV